MHSKRNLIIVFSKKRVKCDIFHILYHKIDRETQNTVHLYMKNPSLLQGTVNIMYCTQFAMRQEECESNNTFVRSPVFHRCTRIGYSE